ncbi:MAG: hypothetical protein KAH64_02960, partial [Nitrosomonadaceae bacterium]|nr:hypothetical protein [Nitrosomonadaceae bacterium]
MLEKRLEEARLRSTKLRKQITIGFLITIAVCSLILVSLSYFIFSTPKDVSVTVPKDVSVTVSIKMKPAEADIEKVRNEFKEIL